MIEQPIEDERSLLCYEKLRRGSPRDQLNYIIPLYVYFYMVRV